MLGVGQFMSVQQNPKPMVAITVKKQHTGPLYTYRIIENCKYMPDPKKEQFEIIANWERMAKDDKDNIVGFIQKSGHQFKHMKAFRLDDLAKRLKAVEYNNGHILKKWQLELDNVYFICSGSVSVFEKRLPSQDNDQQQSNRTNSVFVLNEFQAGDCISDPILNTKVLPSSLLQVTQNGTKILQMKCTEFSYSFKNKMHKIIDERVKEMYDNYSVFKTWEDETLKNFANKLRSKIMNKEEVLFDDGIKAEYVYFITRGALRMEKEVRTKNVKFWPV